jgi:hypothetical protein
LEWGSEDRRTFFNRVILILGHLTTTSKHNYLNYHQVMVLLGAYVFYRDQWLLPFQFQGDVEPWILQGKKVSIIGNVPMTEYSAFSRKRDLNS